MVTITNIYNRECKKYHICDLVEEFWCFGITGTVVLYEEFMYWNMQNALEKIQECLCFETDKFLVLDGECMYSQTQ